MNENADEAVNDLVRLYLPKLKTALRRFARQLRITDEDDIAVDAFYEFFRAVEEKRLTDISNRVQLWNALFRIAERKASDFRKYEYAKKRGGAKRPMQIDELEVREQRIGPEFEVKLMDEFEACLSGINDQRLKDVVKLKLCGYTNQEIANHFRICKRTVAYMISRIRSELLMRSSAMPMGAVA